MSSKKGKKGQEDFSRGMKYGLVILIVGMIIGVVGFQSMINLPGSTPVAPSAGGVLTITNVTRVAFGYGSTTSYGELAALS